MSARRDGLFAFTGSLETLDGTARARLLERGTARDNGDLRARVAAIMEHVRRDGDAALLAMAEQFDHVRLERLEVDRGRCDAALATLPPAVRAALERAAEAIATFHRAQLPQPVDIEVTPGVRLQRRSEPLARVGVYAPGGRAAYPSSVLMGVVPARVAGVQEIIVCSPPGADGLPPAGVLAACALARADRVFALGGAGAIAALALGTASVPRVDRIVGPGNAYVTEAKRQLHGVVAIDCPAGPSEILIVADDSADPAWLAAELIAQAEHDPAASAVLVTTAALQIDAVARAIAALLERQPRADIVRRSLAVRGALLRAASLEAALDFASAFAPEHLLLAVRQPRATLPSVRNAGTIFLGTTTSVSFGDYSTGANHVLPTGGTARAFSGLSTLDFVRFATVQEVSAGAAAALARSVTALAAEEGLPGHAHAARVTAERAGQADGAGMGMRVRLRPAYRDIRTYDPGREPCAIDLSDNTNLFGACPAVATALAALPSAAVTRYPSGYADHLKAALARRFGVNDECITTGCGSDDVIDSALRAFCESGDAVAFPSPTFSALPLFAHMNGLAPRPVPLTRSLRLDVAGLLASDARVLYLCRPNNPTGTAFERTDIDTLIERFPGVTLIDEAYADFAADNLLARALSADNVVILRTLSKAYGLAGLRLGVAIGPPLLIAEIEKSRGPYKVNAIAEHAALAVLENGSDWVDACIGQVRENRARLEQALCAAGYRPVPSQANFVLLPLPVTAGPALDVTRRMRARGVSVRPFPAVPGLGECIRITVGPWPMMAALLGALSTEAPATVVMA